MLHQILNQKNNGKNLALMLSTFFLFSCGPTGLMCKDMKISCGSTPVAAVAVVPGAPAVYTPVFLIGGVTYSSSGGAVQGTIHHGVSNLIQVCYVDSNKNIVTSLNGSGILTTTGNYAFVVGNDGGCSGGTYSCNTFSNGCAPMMGTTVLTEAPATSVTLDVYGNSSTYADLHTTAVVNP